MKTNSEYQQFYKICEPTYIIILIQKEAFSERWNKSRFTRIESTRSSDIATSQNENNPNSNCWHKNARIVVYILKMSVLFKLVHKNSRSQESWSKHELEHFLEI